MSEGRGGVQGYPLLMDAYKDMHFGLYWKVVGRKMSTQTSTGIK